MKIVILSIGEAVCPNCNKLTKWFVDYWRDDDGIKLPNGVECGECDHHLSDEKFEALTIKSDSNGFPDMSKEHLEKITLRNAAKGSCSHESDKLRSDPS